MEDLYMELFKTMNQFRKLHMADMMPEQLNQGDFFTLNYIMDAEDANDMKQLIGYLNEIYNISRTEIEARKHSDRKGTGDA